LRDLSGAGEFDRGSQRQSSGMECTTIENACRCLMLMWARGTKSVEFNGLRGKRRRSD